VRSPSLGQALPRETVSDGTDLQRTDTNNTVETHEQRRPFHTGKFLTNVAFESRFLNALLLKVLHMHIGKLLWKLNMFYFAKVTFDNDKLSKVDRSHRKVFF